MAAIEIATLTSDAVAAATITLDANLAYNLVTKTQESALALATFVSDGVPGTVRSFSIMVISNLLLYRFTRHSSASSRMKRRA